MRILGFHAVKLGPEVFNYDGKRMLRDRVQFKQYIKIRNRKAKLVMISFISSTACLAKVELLITVVVIQCTSHSDNASGVPYGICARFALYILKYFNSYLNQYTREIILFSGKVIRRLISSGQDWKGAQIIFDML